MQNIQRKNALTWEMFSDFTQAVNEAASREDVKFTTVTGVLNWKSNLISVIPLFKKQV